MGNFMSHDPKKYDLAARLLGPGSLSNKAFGVFGKPDENDNLYASTSEAAKKQNLTAQEMRVMNEDDEAALNLLGGRSNIAGMRSKHDKHQDAAEWLLHEVIRESREQNDEWWADQLEGMRDLQNTLRQMLADLMARYNENNERIKFFNDSHERAQSGLKYFRDNHEVFERDKDGKLSNKDVQRLFDDYVARMRLNNPNFQPPVSDGAIYMAVTEQIDWEQKNIITPRTNENTQLAPQIYDIQTQLTVLEKYTNRIHEAQKITDPEARKAAFRQILEDARNDPEDNKVFKQLSDDKSLNSEIRELMHEISGNQILNSSSPVASASDKAQQTSTGFDDIDVSMDDVKPTSAPGPSKVM